MGRCTLTLVEGLECQWIATSVVAESISARMAKINLAMDTWYSVTYSSQLGILYGW